MAILMLLSAAAAVALRPALEDAQLRSATGMVVAGLRYARSYAIAHHAETALVIETATLALSVQTRTTDTSEAGSWQTVTTPAGRRRSLPQGLTVRPTGQGPSLASSEPFLLIFSALGRTESTALQITDGRGGVHELVVDGVTGRCAPAEEAQ